MTRSDLARLLAFYALVIGTVTPWLIVLRMVAQMVRL